MKLFSDKSVKEAQTDKKIVTLYQNNCANCHGPSGEGYDPYPTLKGQQLPVDYVKEMIMEGSGDMPAFPYIKDPDLTKLAEYVNQMQ